MNSDGKSRRRPSSVTTSTSSGIMSKRGTSLSPRREKKNLEQKRLSSGKSVSSLGGATSLAERKRYERKMGISKSGNAPRQVGAIPKNVGVPSSSSRQRQQEQKKLGQQQSRQPQHYKSQNRHQNFQSQQEYQIVPTHKKKSSYEENINKNPSLVSMGPQSDMSLTSHSHSRHQSPLLRRPQRGTPPTHPNTAQVQHNNNNNNGHQHPNPADGHHHNPDDTGFDQLPRQMTDTESVKEAIEGLNKAIGHDLRIAAITNACEEFDHWDTNKHNLELNMGAANVLSLVLSMTDDDDEIRMICAALEMVYRGSNDAVHKSFSEVGSAVVPLLLRLLERCESGSMRNADVSIMNITKVLLYFSRVQKIRLPLVRHQGLLTALVRVATSILNVDSRVVRMRVMANLANAEVNRVTMCEHAGLIESLVKVASLDLCESAREYAAAAIMDLAGSPNNQIIMAKSDKLLATLVKLTVTDSKLETREYAVTAIQNLAFAKENRTRLASYCSGVILEALKKNLIGEESNDKARRRAAGALTNLACEETAEILGQHEGLLDVLAEVSTSDGSDDVQKRAALALTKIANSITSKMPCHETLLSSMVKTASSIKCCTNVAAVLRSKARIMENRFSMARHPNLLETLAEISTSDESNDKDKDNAMRAIMHLTNENANRKMMANKSILDALVHAASLSCVTHENEVIRDSAITAIERLATDVSNRRIMARHDGLLVAIAKATEREAKAEKLAPDKAKPRLAKPLLMSLLVAM